MSHFFQLKKISQYRTELMGLGTFLILICHASISGVILPPPVSYVFSFGNLGVEIFFFLSGIGMVYSLSRHSGSFISWYKKRLERILVPYCFIAIPWFSWHAYIHEESFGHVLVNISTLNYWLYHEGAWFIAILIPLYLLTPVLYKIIQSNYWPTIIPLIGITSVCTLFPSDGVIYNILWAVHRLPCFFIGMLAAKWIIENRQINLHALFLTTIVAMGVLRGIDPMIGWHWPIIFIWIPLVCMFFDRFPKLSNLSAYLGLISLESYILNLLLKDMFPVFSWDSCGYSRYACIILLGLLLTPLVNSLTKRTLSLITR